MHDHNRRFEEATIPTVKRYRSSMKAVRRAVGDMFRATLVDLHRIIARATLPDGSLDQRQRDRVLLDAGNRVLADFVADGRHAFAADGVTARTPFAQLLNTFYVRVTLEAIYQQRDWLAKNTPRDVFQFLSRARPLTLGEAENPFLRRDGEDDEAFRQRLEDLRVFQPNPLMELDPNRQWVPMHRWVDPNGYRLSDRIWRAGNSTRDKIDAMIGEAFAQGWSALELSRKLEQFLLPDRANLRTNKPYGVNASAAALRLARTEIARAANHAAFISAYLNPYVDRIDVARSPNGDRSCAICPRHATLSFGGERLRLPYSIYSANIPGFHPSCMCHVRPVLSDSPETVTMRLQAVVDDIHFQNFPPSVNPAAADALTQTLLHQALGTVVGQFRGQFVLPGF